mmetsp:Transcript_47806/g.103751  ORF Transcript_47806/g.103751 Transcript_47806/m.103751 type:complete len:256 (-) Transcript_47806:30-797(-)
MVQSGVLGRDLPEYGVHSKPYGTFSDTKSSPPSDAQSWLFNGRVWAGVAAFALVVVVCAVVSSSGGSTSQMHVVSKAQQLAQKGGAHPDKADRILQAIKTNKAVEKQFEQSVELGKQALQNQIKNLVSSVKVLGKNAILKHQLEKTQVQKAKQKAKLQAQEKKLKYFQDGQKNGVILTAPQHAEKLTVVAQSAKCVKALSVLKKANDNLRLVQSGDYDGEVTTLAQAVNQQHNARLRASGCQHSLLGDSLAAAQY